MRNLHEAKKEKLATQFFKDIKVYQQKNNEKYPKYGSNYKYYKDVFVNLLICQKGLCAYSEMALDFDYSEKKEANLWKKGRFIGKKTIIDADIEHYKAKSSCKEECDWDWNNLFLVSIHINQRIKRDKPVANFMRPDNQKYAPEKYLCYDFNTQMFVPKPSLDDKTYQEVDKTISTLGINTSDTVKSRRKALLLDFITDIYNGKYTYAEIKKTKLHEFFTAFKMSEPIFSDKNKMKKYISNKKKTTNKN